MIYIHEYFPQQVFVNIKEIKFKKNKLLADS